MLRRLMLSIAVVAGLGTAAFAAGMFPYPTVQPAGTTGSVTINGQTIPQGGYTTLPLTGSETVPADTNLSSGRTPQTEAITVDQLHSYFRAPRALTSAASLAIDGTLANVFTMTLSANHTLATPSNLMDGQVFDLVFRQDSTGSRTVTSAGIPIWTWNNLASGTGAILSTAANAVDTARCIYDSGASTPKIRCAILRAYTQP